MQQEKPTGNKRSDPLENLIIWIFAAVIVAGAVVLVFGPGRVINFFDKISYLLGLG